MNLNKKNKIIISILVGAVVLFSAASEIYRLYSISKTQSPSYGQSIITAEDLQPLAIPPKSRVLKLPILMYHHVGDLPENANKTQIGLTVTPQEFEHEVNWLQAQGYHSISLEDLYLYSVGKFKLPPKPIIFTFDDGYDDVFNNAVPTLKKYGFTGSFAIITQFPGTKMGKNSYATWDQIAQAYQQGNEIVSHTQNHFDGKNKKISTDYIFQNLSGSITDIKNHLGLTTNILIYPFGHYTPSYVEQAKKNGFVMGVTVHEGNTINLDNLMEVPRIRMHRNEDFIKFQQLVAE